MPALENITFKLPPLHAAFSGRDAKTLLTFLWLAASSDLLAQSTSYDTLYLFDHRSQLTVRRWGRQPLWLRFPAGDTLVLNANNKGRQGLYFKSETWRTPGHDYPIGEGVRILYPRGSRLCVQARSLESVGRHRFALDTLLCVDSLTPKPWIFWNTIRKKKRGGLFFKPQEYVLANYEWAHQNNHQHRRARRILQRVRYQYNTATGLLTDRREPQQK